jgi:hypothetical protein
MSNCIMQESAIPSSLMPLIACYGGTSRFLARSPAAATRHSLLIFADTHVADTADAISPSRARSSRNGAHGAVQTVSSLRHPVVGMRYGHRRIVIREACDTAVADETSGWHAILASPASIISIASTKGKAHH